MGQQRGSRGPCNRDHEKEERKAHGAAAKIRDARPPPEEPGRDQRHTNQEDRLKNEFPERCGLAKRQGDRGHEPEAQQDRKSTRLNSSHLVISYAVFCLKKKKIILTG